MAHAPGAPDLDLERLVVALDGAADRLAEREATRPRGNRVLHDVDRKRNHRARPGVGLAAHEAQRDRQTVVDIHLVDDGEVEVLLDDRLGDMSGELGMPDHLWHRPRAPSFVGRYVVRRRANGDGRDQIEAEGGGMVVEYQEDEVG